MPNSKQIVYLSQSQYAELIINGTITVNGVTVTYNENDIYVTPQAEPVTDVQVNGTSVVVNGVANVPYGTSSVFGLMSVGNGLRISNSTGKAIIDNAGTAKIKAGTETYNPIVPSYQHESTFYGLAKAAGDSTQSASSNAVGTYTDNAKAVIQHMLGTDTIIAPYESDTTADQSYSINENFMMNGKLYKATSAITQGATITPGTNCDETSLEELRIKDIQVNGNSIISSGVANVPLAASGVLGVVKSVSDGGILIDANGNIKTNPPGETVIKTGTEGRRPIVPYSQHVSTFYGLAKAAGDITQSASENAVGTYTDSAKSAIQNMLNVTDKGMFAPSEPTTTASQAYAIGDIFIHNNKLYKATAAITQGGTIVTSGNDANVVETMMPRDVQINGTSVITNGVANVPVGSSSTFGVFKRGTGLYDSNGVIGVNSSSDADVKGGVLGTYTTVSRQHLAVFYGLAKAAGDTTQAQSDNAIGTYTDEAKTAIKNMLGITQTLTVTVNTQDNVTVTDQTVYVREDDENGPIYAQAAYEGQPVSFAVPSGFHYYVNVSDTLAHHFNPTTATGIITNTNISVTLQYSDFSSIQSAADIKAALNADLDLTDLVGETITCTKGTDTLTWDVVDYDSTNKTITLLLHDAFGSANMVFEPAQALMWCENGLTAGNYTFKWNTTQCYFTLTQAIPAGGQLRATNSVFSTYESQSATATIETGTVSTTEITGATDLGTTAQGLLNHHDRVNYGSNNYAESALYWWLNSDAAANTPRTPVTKFSRAYSYNVAGFMNGLDASFVSCLDNTVWKSSTNNVYECPSSLGGTTPGKQNSYTVTAKFGLASEMEIFGSYGGTADDSVIFDLYNGASADDRKKYRNTTVQTWWLRSPGWNYAISERYVTSSGSASVYAAITSYAVVPACRISKDV